MATQAFDDVAKIKMARVREAKTRIASRSAQRLESLQSLVDDLGVAHGQSWLIEGTAQHRLRVGDGLSMSWPDAGCLCFDPPWEKPWKKPSVWFENALVFTSSRYLGESIEAFGSGIAWQFIWDIQSCQVSGRKPLLAHNTCLWYGKLSSYRWLKTMLPEAALLPSGKRLSDIYREPLTSVVRGSNHPHAKPQMWVAALIARCSQGLVVDPTVGSGTTLFAAEQVGRDSVVAEYNISYAAQILDRAKRQGMTVSRDS